MASVEAKARRKAEGLNELERLSNLLGEHLDIEMPNIRVTDRDPEFQGILRVEAINQVLARVLDSVGVKASGDDLESMTKAELLQMAEEKGLEISKSAKKAEIIEALNK